MNAHHGLAMHGFYLPYPERHRAQWKSGALMLSGAKPKDGTVSSRSTSRGSRSDELMSIGENLADFLRVHFVGYVPAYMLPEWNTHLRDGGRPQVYFCNCIFIRRRC